MRSATVRAAVTGQPIASGASRTARIPSAYVEYGFYFVIFYAVLGSAVGLSLPVPGAAVVLFLALVSVAGLPPRARALFKPLAFAMGCGVSYLLVQLLVHDEPLMGEYVRPFVTWMLMLIVAQTLMLRRGFLHRLSLSIFLIGLAALPFLEIEVAGVARARLGTSGAIANGNDLAAWFGFCAVYFAVSAIEGRRAAVRVACFVLSLACLGVVGLTVSRTALAAAVIATTVASRRILRAGFVSVLFFVVVASVVIQTEPFQQAMSKYSTRAFEETGRLRVWPVAFGRFLDSPVVGVGASEVATDVGSPSAITPHNGFLFLALSSGFVPVLFFAAFWWRVGRGVMRVPRVTGDLAYAAPFLVYAFICTQSSNLVFFAPWAVGALVVGASVMVLRRQSEMPVPLVWPGREPGGWGRKRSLAGWRQRGRARV